MGKGSEQDPSYMTVPFMSLWKETTKLLSLGGGGATDLLQKLDEAFSSDEVERLGKALPLNLPADVNSPSSFFLPLFPAFLLDSADSYDHVDSGSAGPEATLGLRIDAGCQCL